MKYESLLSVGEEMDFKIVSNRKSHPLTAPKMVSLIHHAFPNHARLEISLAG